MTNEEAELYLKMYIKAYWKGTIVPPKPSVINMAIEALENQIPKEPILRSNGPLSFIVTACCPRCGSTNYDKYCSNCGQRIIKVATV